MKRKTRRIMLAVVLSAAAIGGASYWYFLWSRPAGLKNFHRVSPTLYRGAQPGADGMRELERLGVATVLNLRHTSDDRPLLAGTALKYYRIKVDPWHLKDDDVEAFLRIVTDPRLAPVFMHCRYGADRTGTMCAVYRVVVQGWTKTRAIDEMVNSSFGFHSQFRHLVTYIEQLDVESLRRRFAVSQPAHRGAVP